MWQDLVTLFSTSQAWVALLMLTFMEIILGIDNILFISIFSNKLPEAEQPRARNIGLMLAMGLRIGLLFTITLIADDPEHPNPLFHIDFWNVHGAPTLQSLILFVGGLFLLYKSISEIHHKLEGDNPDAHADDKAKSSLGGVIAQIAVINLVFSLDSILTAVGFTQDLAREGYQPLPVMVLGVVLSVLMMMAFAGPIGRLINRHPSIQILGLSFLLLIGFMLIAEAAHTAHLVVGDVAAGIVPKGYLYFAIGFSLLVEYLNIRFRKKSPTPVVQLRGALQQAKERNLHNMNPEQ